ELEALFREKLEETSPKTGIPGLILTADPELVAIVDAAMRGDLTPGKKEKTPVPRPTGRAALDPDSLQTEDVRTLGRRSWPSKPGSSWESPPSLPKKA
ncbi:transposase, partial [mine drainage metagenome]